MYSKVRTFSPYPIESIPLYKKQNARCAVRRKGCALLCGLPLGKAGERQPLAPADIYVFYVKKPLEQRLKSKSHDRNTSLFLPSRLKKQRVYSKGVNTKCRYWVSCMKKEEVICGRKKA